jgi:hypothetical protein
MTQSEAGAEPQRTARPRLAQQLGLFDATMMVMGGIVGAGVFMNPYVVAQRLHTPVLILAAWMAGGAIAIAGSFIYAELGARIPKVGGQYVYLREALHPVFGFLYGWALLLIIQTGGMAAVAVTFARYFLELTHLPVSERTIVIATLALLTAINCLGVKVGSRVQSILMVLKIGAIACLVAGGFFLVKHPQPVFHPVLDRPVSFDLLTAMGAAMVPVIFSYGGWQTTNFIAGEIRNPRRNLARALVIGVAAVVVLYVSVNLVCVRALGVDALAATTVPASAVMRFDCAGHCGVDGGVSEPVGADRAARLFCDGGRRAFLSQRRVFVEENECAGGGDCAAELLDAGDRDDRALRPDSELSGADRCDLLWAERSVFVCAAASGASGGRTRACHGGAWIPRAGASGDDRSLHPRVLGDCGECAVEVSTEQFCRSLYSSFRIAGLLLAESSPEAGGLIDEREGARSGVGVSGVGEAALCGEVQSGDERHHELSAGGTRRAD